MNGVTSFAKLRNGVAIGVHAVPQCDVGRFRRAIVEAVADGARVSAFFGDTSGPADPVDLYAVLADDAAGVLFVGKTRVKHDDFHSLTPECPQVNLFEREIAEQFGLRPEGHPWLKPVRFVAELARVRAAAEHGNRILANSATPLIGVTNFYRMQGEEIHEVAVGPVHAGVIEPGNFQFQCHGEHVFYMEISLGYQHRGVERALVGGPNKRTIHYMETLAGDTSGPVRLQVCLGQRGVSPLQARALRPVTEGNCVAVRRGGKQPEVNDQSATQVNSIRPCGVASPLARGEARTGAIRKSATLMGSVIKRSRDEQGGWRRNGWKARHMTQRDLLGTNRCSSSESDRAGDESRHAGVSCSESDRSAAWMRRAAGQESEGS